MRNEQKLLTSKFKFDNKKKRGAVQPSAVLREELKTHCSIDCLI